MAGEKTEVQQGTTTYRYEKPGQSRADPDGVEYDIGLKDRGVMFCSPFVRN